MKKSLLSHSFLSICLGTTVFFSLGDLRAKEPSLYFYPAAKWSVSALEGGDMPKCSIFSEFNNGYVVEFVGNAQNFTAVNIDFREDAFEKNKVYSTKLSVPGVATANISAKAYESNAVTADLREKKDFSKALINASVLDIELESNAFRFYMTGLKASLKDYDHCTETKPLEQEVALEDQIEKKIPIIAKAVPAKKIDESKAFAAAALQTPEVPVVKPLVEPTKNLPPVATLEKAPEVKPPPVKSEKKPISSEQALNEIYGDKIKATEPKKVPITLEKKEIKPQQPLEPEAKIEEEQSWFSSIFGSSDEPQPQTAKAETKSEKDVAMPAKKQEFVPKLAQNDLQETKPVLAKNPAVVENYRSPPPVIKKAPPIKMEADFTKIPDEPIEISAAEKKADMPAIEEIADIEPAAARPVDASADLRGQISELEQQVSHLKNKNSDLERDMKETLTETRQEELSVSSENWNLERATMKFNEAERQIARLGRKLQTQKTQCEVEKKELEGMLFDPQVTDQQQLAKLAALEADLEKTKADLLMQKRSYDERIKILEEQLSGN